MTNSILEKKWTLWHPKKIFLKNSDGNKKNLCFFDHFTEEDFFFDSQCKKKHDHDNDLKITEAYELGFKKGLSEGQKECIFLEKKFSRLFFNFENSFSTFENILYSRLLKIVLKISSYVIGKKIDIDESILSNHLKKIIDQDGVFLKKPYLIIHPNNKILIEKILAKFLNTYKWTLLYDKDIDENSCKIKSESSNIDTTVNARWQELSRLIDVEEEY